MCLATCVNPGEVQLTCGHSLCGTHGRAITRAWARAATQLTTGPGAGATGAQLGEALDIALPDCPECGTKMTSNDMHHLQRQYMD